MMSFQNPSSFFPALLLSAFTLGALGAAAAQEPSEKEHDDENGATKGPMAARVERLESLVDDQNATIEELQKEVENLRESQKEGELTKIASSDGGIGGLVARHLKIYGFFDLGVFHSFIEEDNPLDSLSNTDFTFTMTNINVYFASQMTATFSAMVELRFTFLPNGQENFIPFERTDTTVTDPISNEEIRLGGVAIERARVTWSPRDYFRVTAGRYLTPFGIWNVEHGSPVIIPMFPPVMHYRHIIPLSQTGIQVHGDLYPSDDLTASYAITVSNGRGPTDTTTDLDRNKALGLRLKLSYESPKTRWHIGGYGYYGTYADNAKEILPVFPIEVEKTQTEAYTELSYSVDALVEIGGLRLQAEYVWRRVDYDVRPRRVLPVINKSVAFERQPDHFSWDAYGIVAYTLPLKPWLKAATLTPFFFYEHSVVDDTNPNFDTASFRFGLNFKPNSYVVLKAIGTGVVPLDSVYLSSSIWSVCAQIAVIF